MAEKPRTVLEIEDFVGLFLRDDPTDLPNGAAQDQLNAVTSVQGQIQARSGVLPILFDAST